MLLSNTHNQNELVHSSHFCLLRHPEIEIHGHGAKSNLIWAWRRDALAACRQVRPTYIVPARGAGRRTGRPSRHYGSGPSRGVMAVWLTSRCLPELLKWALSVPEA